MALGWPDFVLKLSNRLLTNPFLFESVCVDVYANDAICHDASALLARWAVQWITLGGVSGSRMR